MDREDARQRARQKAKELRHLADVSEAFADGHRIEISLNGSPWETCLFPVYIYESTAGVEFRVKEEMWIIRSGPEIL